MPVDAVVREWRVGPASAHGLPEVVQGRDHFMGQRLEILAGGVKRDVGKSRVRGSWADPGEASRPASFPKSDSRRDTASPSH